MPVSESDIVNQAIALIGDKTPPVTGTAPNFDDSPAGIAARYLYPAAVAFVAKTFEWDYARRWIALELSGQGAPLDFQFEYLYPTNGIEVWQVYTIPVVPMDPRPTTWVIANALVNGVQTKVIWTNAANARAIYNNNPGPDVWDAAVREAIVRHLASEMAMALAGRPETSENMLQSGAAARGLAETREG